MEDTLSESGSGSEAYPDGGNEANPDENILNKVSGIVLMSLVPTTVATGALLILAVLVWRGEMGHFWY